MDEAGFSTIPHERLSHYSTWEETQCGQQWLNVFFANFDTRRVTELDKKLQGAVESIPLIRP